MAISTYSELQTAIAAWAHNDALTTLIPDFISLAESSFNRALHTRTMETDNVLSLVSGTRTVALPTGFVEPISLKVVISGQTDEPLVLVRPHELAVNADSSASRQPEYWAINGTNIEFANLADQTYALSLRMISSAFNLSVSTPTNWLLTNHPDLYLYGSMIHAASYMVNDARIPVWQMKYEKALREVQNNAKRSRSRSLMTDHPSASHGGYNILTDN